MFHHDSYLNKRPAVDDNSTSESGKRLYDKEKEELICLLEDEVLCCEQIIRSKIAHTNDAVYDLHSISFKKDGVTHDTRFVLCDHELCRGNLRKALYKGKRSGAKRAGVDFTISKKHEDRNHFNKAKRLNYLATKWVVKKNLPLDHFESEEAKAFIAELDPKTKNGISRFIIESNLTVMADETKTRIREFACSAIDSLTASLLIDEYDYNSVKYCGVVLCVYDPAKGTHDLWFLSFERIDKSTDAAKRAHVREVLADYGLEEFYDNNRLVLTGDYPIKKCFENLIAIVCTAHTISNIIKNFIKKSSSDFAEKWLKIVAANTRFCKKKKRPGCAKASLNDEIKEYSPTDPVEVTWIKRTRGSKNEAKILCMQPLNPVRFRSSLDVMHRLHVAKHFIQSENRMKYADGNEIDWDLVAYMHCIGKIFNPVIDAADSDSFMVCDALFIHLHLLTTLLNHRPANNAFKDAHRDLIFSTLDYLVGNRMTERWAGVGNDIKGRAEPMTIIGLFFDIDYGCDFKFTDLRAAVKTALQNGVFDSYDDMLVSSILDQISDEWSKIVEETAKQLLKKIDKEQDIVLDTPPEEESESQDLFNTAFTEEEDLDQVFGLRSRFKSKIQAATSSSQPDLMIEISKWRNYDFNIYKDWYLRQPSNVQNATLPSPVIRQFFQHNATFPMLSKLALLCSQTPGSSSALERKFSKCSTLLTSNRSELASSTAEKILLVDSMDCIDSYAKRL